MTWDEDGLRRDELVSVGGTWSALLFENQHAGFPLSLVWTFTFDFAEVTRDFGNVAPNVCVDWVPLPGANWSSMEGRSAAASVFGEPIEASVYFFEHHRFDSATIALLEQDGTRLRVSAELTGDVDELGLDALSAAGWLDFVGIYVQPDAKPISVEAARDLLASFTDPTGLVGVDRSHTYLFEPDASDRR